MNEIDNNVLFHTISFWYGHTENRYTLEIAIIIVTHTHV